MAYTTIKKPSNYFNTNLYTGNNTETSHTVGFQPDFTWLKVRNAAGSHYLFDSMRLATKYLQANTTSAEGTDANTLKSFDANGYTVGTSNSVNTNNETMVGWNWKANGAGVANTDGSISSTVSASATSGFSIVSWTGSGASDTVGHGLSSSPELVIVKNRTDAATDWRIGNSFISGQTMADGNGYYLEFDCGAIANPGSQTIWGSPPANPTSTVFKVGSNNSNNGSSDAMIAYCFHSVQGFSKFGSYIGNGSTDGTFIYTGFKPAFVLLKKTTGDHWTLLDNKRNTYNPESARILANLDFSEASSATLDFLSNGFKCLRTDAGENGSGIKYIYMAFAEEPLVGDNPATAR